MSLFFVFDYNRMTEPLNANTTMQDNINPSEGGLSNAAHPVACIFTFLFKAASFFVYASIKVATSYSEISSQMSIPSS